MALEYTITTADQKNFNDNNCSLWVGSRNIGALKASINTNDLLEFKANDGFAFTTAPILELKSGRQYPFKKVSDVLYTLVAPSGATGAGYYKWIVKTVSTAPVIPVYTFTQTDVDTFTAKKVTAKVGAVNVVNGTVINQGDVLTLSTDQDYYFEYAQVLTLLGMVYPFTINSEKTVATYTAVSEDAWREVDFNTEFKEFVCFEVTQTDLDKFATNLSKGYINDVPMALGDTVNVGDVIKFEVTNPRYDYDGINIRYGVLNRTTSMIRSADKKSCSITWLDREVINLFTFFTSTQFPSVYTFTEENYKYFTDRFAIPFANGVELVLGDEIYKDDAIEIKTDPAYEFLIGEQVRIIGSIFYDMVIAEDRKSATHTYNSDLPIYEFQFTTTKSAKVDTDTSNNTYLITPRELRNLESLNLKEFNVDGQEITDRSNLLVGVMRYPFKIPSDNLGALAGIYIGSKQYEEVKATDVDTDILEIDLGTIHIENKYGDLRDYADTEAILRLPQLNSVNLDLEYVIGQTVGIKYFVNLINGETTVIITSSKLPPDNNTLLTLNATIGTGIPIAHKNGFDYQPIDAEGMRLGGINLIDKPTIDIVRNEFANSDSMFTIPVKDSGLLTDFQGWTKIDDIVLTVNATQQEKQEIVNLLKAGVFFNE